MPVQDAVDITADQFLADRAFFIDIEHPEVGSALPDAALPFLIDGRRAAHGRRPPLLGEHNREVFARAGYSEQDLAELALAGAC